MVEANSLSRISRARQNIGGSDVQSAPIASGPLTPTAATVAIMADRDDWTPGDITGMVANPFYAITIDEGLALPHQPMISEDDWIKANVKLINELGPEPYLRNLLSILKGNYPGG